MDGRDVPHLARDNAQSAPTPPCLLQLSPLTLLDTPTQSLNLSLVTQKMSFTFGFAKNVDTTAKYIPTEEMLRILNLLQMSESFRKEQIMLEEQKENLRLEWQNIGIILKMEDLRCPLENILGYLVMLLVTFMV